MIWELTLAATGLAAIGLAWLTKKRILYAWILFALLLALMDLSVVQSLGRAKPYNFVLDKTPHEVLYYDFDFGERIYLLVDGPYLWKLPWDIDLAQKLQQQGQEAKETGTRLLLRGGTTRGGEINIWAEPVDEARPPKHTPP